VARAPLTGVRTETVIGDVNESQFVGKLVEGPQVSAQVNLADIPIRLMLGEVCVVCMSRVSVSVGQSAVCVVQEVVKQVAKPIIKVVVEGLEALLALNREHFVEAAQVQAVDLIRQVTNMQTRHYLHKQIGLSDMQFRVRVVEVPLVTTLAHLEELPQVPSEELCKVDPIPQTQAVPKPVDERVIVRVQQLVMMPQISTQGMMVETLEIKTRKQAMRG